MYASGAPGEVRTNFAKNKENAAYVLVLAVALSFQGGSPWERKALSREQGRTACISSSSLESVPGGLERRSTFSSLLTLPVLTV